MRPTLRLLDDRLIQKIVAEARLLLCTLGVTIHNESVLSILGDHGAKVDLDKQHATLTDPVIDRLNRETWEEGGSMQLWDRACMQVEERLANYAPIENDAAIDTAMRELVRSGFDAQESLPDLPPPPDKPAAAVTPGRRGRRGRRRRG